jgi:hypothetical protein
LNTAQGLLMEVKPFDYDTNQNINKAISNEFIDAMDMNQINSDNDIDYADVEIDVQIKNKMSEKMITFVVGESQEENENNQNIDVFINKNDENIMYKNEECNEKNIIIKDDNNNINNNITTSIKINEDILVDNENINNIPFLSRITSDRVVVDEENDEENDIVNATLAELNEENKEIISPPIGIEKDLVRSYLNH